MEREHHKVIQLANRLLDESWADPDDDLRVLSRQLLRRHEYLLHVKTVLLPMAMGYAAEHDVGNNRKMVEEVGTFFGNYFNDNEDDERGIEIADEVPPSLEQDPLFEDAQRLLCERDRNDVVTTNDLRKCFRITYARASGLIDQLEAASVISAPDPITHRRKVV
jgi:DNA segregation ATPase FtsK/SpoIIIE-like protein